MRHDLETLARELERFANMVAAMHPEVPECVQPDIAFAVAKLTGAKLKLFELAEAQHAEDLARLAACLRVDDLKRGA